MMSTRIDLVEKFGVCTVLMSYYGTTDQSFLLLSQINSKSREMLDTFYEEILNSMINNTTCLWLDKKFKRKLYLPWDLFIFKIILDSEIKANTFLQFLQDINDRKGYYFNQHFMHTRLWIEPIEIDDKLVAILYPSLELLKTTEVNDYIIRILKFKLKMIM